MKLRIQTIFLALAIVQGVLFAIFVPPNEIPDEGAHFARVYDIAQGNIIPSQEVILPGEFANILAKYHIGFEKARTIDTNQYFEDFNDRKDSSLPAPHSLAHYSPVNYMPQTIGLLLGSALNLSARWAFLLGRLFGLAFYVLIAYTILQKSQSFHHILLVLFAMPMAVYLAASYSADGVLLSLSFLYIHLILTISNSQAQINKKEIAILIGLGIVLALTKQISLLLVLLLFAIPTSRFGSIQKKYFLWERKLSSPFFSQQAGYFLHLPTFPRPAIPLRLVHKHSICYQIRAH